MNEPHQSSPAGGQPPTADLTAKRECFAQAAREWREMPSAYVGTRIVRHIPVVIFREEDPFGSRKMYDELLLNVCLSMATDFGARFPIYRGVEPVALRRILRRGIDVYPTDSPLWANTLEKALEYGRLVTVLDRNHVRRSYKSLGAGATPAEIANAEAEFGSEYDARPNGSRYYSRWPKGHRARNPAYEMEHGCYIPGDPFAALIGLLYFAGGEESP